MTRQELIALYELNDKLSDIDIDFSDFYQDYCDQPGRE